MSTLPEKRFQRTIEDFTCAHCSEPIIGDGYTNHCPKCLWSKHVDIHPGDRACKCDGLMKPIGVEIVRGEHDIVHKCVTCEVVRRNQAHPNDDFSILLKIAESQEAE